VVSSCLTLNCCCFCFLQSWQGLSHLAHRLFCYPHCQSIDSYEEKTGWVTLSYAWQAVFRSYELWSHRALADYKYMIWIDDDALPTKSWLKDPIVPMVEENLVVLYDNFPAGFCKSGGIIEKMQLAYNHSYCYIHRIHEFKGNQTGKFVVRPCKKNKHGEFILDKFGKCRVEHVILLELEVSCTHLFIRPCSWNDAHHQPGCLSETDTSKL
jgi:hypothetical protein